MRGTIDAIKTIINSRAGGRCAVLVLAGLFGAVVAATAQDDNSPWVAPDDAKKVQNPIKPTPEALASAAHVFKLNCAGCHGMKGDGNGAAAEGLERKPANFTDVKKMSETTDGELFWKMSTGRPPMPTWQQTLSDTQRWELVNYLRTFAAKAAAAGK
jgi:mono/diheme cytochrome c family protein